jgi:arabinofuranosyltransferase
MSANSVSARPGSTALPANRTSVWNAAVVVWPVLVWAILIWRRRWMSDDGLIVLRTVRQIVAGNGPVFNVGERVETNTSALWGWMLVLPELVPGMSLNWAAVLLGLVLSVTGLAFAMDGARRLWGADRPIVPAGALVVCALPPFWDFGTSGLETGLIFCWLGVTWWMLVRLAGRHRAGPRIVRVWPTGVAIGLGPLVRPELALVTVAFGLLVAVVSRRRGLRRLVGAAAVAAVLPVGYEIFRAAYYGVLVPAPAMAKEATGARWNEGVLYLLDLVEPYLLWLPSVLLAFALVVVQRRPAATGPEGQDRCTVPLVAVPVIVSVTLAVYVVRVGGDFMHGRMLLPALFCALLPLMALPLTRLTAVPLVALVSWSIVCAVALRSDHQPLDRSGITDERLHYVVFLQQRHPIVLEDFLLQSDGDDALRLLDEEPAPSVAMLDRGPTGLHWSFLPATAPGDTLIHFNLGVAGEAAPLDTRVLDRIGLSDPLAAHSEQVPNGRIGHLKDLPLAWHGADAVVPGATDPLDPTAVKTAWAFLGCPAMLDLLASYRAPLTFDRAVDNLRGALGRTALRFPRDPLATEGCQAIN